MLVPSLVQLGDERGDRLWILEIPMPDLVFLGVAVFLGSRDEWLVLHQLEGGAVDPAIGAEGGGQHVTGHEHRPATGLELLGEDVACWARNWVGRSRPRPGHPCIRPTHGVCCARRSRCMTG